VRGRGSVVAADQERSAADPDASRDSLTLALRSVLADLRLAGLQRGDASALIEQEVDALWQENDA